MGMITYCTLDHLYAAQASLKSALIGALVARGILPAAPSQPTPTPLPPARGLVPFPPRSPVVAALVGKDNVAPLLTLWAAIRDSNPYYNPDPIQFELFCTLARYGATEDAMELTLAAVQGWGAWFEVYGEPVEDGEKFARACIGTGTVELIAALD